MSEEQPKKHLTVTAFDGEHVACQLTLGDATQEVVFPTLESYQKFIEQENTRKGSNFTYEAAPIKDFFERGELDASSDHIVEGSSRDAEAEAQRLAEPERIIFYFRPHKAEVVNYMGQELPRFRGTHAECIAKLAAEKIDYETLNISGVPINI